MRLTAAAAAAAITKNWRECGDGKSEYGLQVKVEIERQSG
jgi:hypothetical protein